jgi:hypothetical protein
MYQEETAWFPELRAKVAHAEQLRIAERYCEEVARYLFDGVSAEVAEREPRGHAYKPLEDVADLTHDGATGSPPLGDANSASENRGKRADFQGPEARGSGAGAGGGGSREDFDTDPQAGGGKLQQAHPEAQPSHGADAPIGGSH